MAAINESVTYISPFRIGEYPAIVRAVNMDGTVAIDVYIEAMKHEPALHLRSVSYGPEGRARPRKNPAD